MKLSTREVIIKAKEKGYYSDKDGNIYSKNKKLKKNLHSNGYYRFFIKHEMKSYYVMYHRYIAYLKYGDNLFKEGIVVRHLDGNSENNAWDNIVLGSESDNRMDIPKEVRVRSAVTASKKIRRFSEEEILKIKRDKAMGYSYKDLCKKYDTSKSTLSYFFNKSMYCS